MSFPFLEFLEPLIFFGVLGRPFSFFGSLSDLWNFVRDFVPLLPLGAVATLGMLWAIYSLVYAVLFVGHAF